MPNLTLGGATATCLIEICAVRCEPPELPLVKFVELDRAVVAASADTAIRTARTLARAAFKLPRSNFSTYVAVLKIAMDKRYPTELWDSRNILSNLYTIWCTMS